MSDTAPQDERIAVYIAMGDKRQIGHSSRPLANTIYRTNCADLHTKTENIPVFDEEGNPVYQVHYLLDSDGNEIALLDENNEVVRVPVLEEDGTDSGLTEIAHKTESRLDKDGNPIQKTERVTTVLGLLLKPFVVVAIRNGRRVSRKQILSEREAEDAPFGEGVVVEEVEAPVKYGGIVVGGGDDLDFSDEAKAAAAAAADDDGTGLVGADGKPVFGTKYQAPGMGPSEIDKLAEQMPDISGAMGGHAPARPLTPLIQSRGYSGHEWKWGETEIDFDVLWDGLNERERAMLHDEAMEIVQNASPTKARDTHKILVGPGDATYDERAKDL